MFLEIVILQTNQKKCFMIKKVRNTVLWTYVVNDLYGEEFFGNFYENRLQKNKSKKIELKK